MNRRPLPDEECRQRAGEWAAELFGLGPVMSVVFVRYDAWGTKRAGRRNKPPAVQAESEVMAALLHGDIDSAFAAMARVGRMSDPGLALCRDRESLAEVLAERLRSGEYCFVDGLFHERAATLTAWRE